MTETIRTVMALHGLYPDVISNALRVQDVYGDSRSYCVRCGRTWTSHVTWIKLDLRSQRVLKNWKQPCLDCGQEVSPYITSEELERMVTIAVERCMEMIDEQRSGTSSGSAMSPSLQKRRRSPDKPSKDGEPERVTSREERRMADASLTPVQSDQERIVDTWTPSSSLRFHTPRSNIEETNSFSVEPFNRQPQAVRSFGQRPGRRQFKPTRHNNVQTSPQCAPATPVYTTGLVPVQAYIYCDPQWLGQPQPYPVALSYVPGSDVRYQQLSVRSPSMPVCCS